MGSSFLRTEQEAIFNAFVLTDTLEQLSATHFTEEKKGSYMKTTASQSKIIKQNVFTTYHSHHFRFCTMIHITYRFHFRKLGTSPFHLSPPKTKTHGSFYFFLPIQTDIPVKRITNPKYALIDGYSFNKNQLKLLHRNKLFSFKFLVLEH